MSPIRPNRPTTVTAAAVSAPLIAAAKVSVAITRITTRANVTWTIGLLRIPDIVGIHQHPLLNIKGTYKFIFSCFMLIRFTTEGSKHH